MTTELYQEETHVEGFTDFDLAETFGISAGGRVVVCSFSCPVTEIYHRGKVVLIRAMGEDVDLINFIDDSHELRVQGPGSRIKTDIHGLTIYLPESVKYERRNCCEECDDE